MRLQVLIDHRGEIEQRALHLCAGDFRLVGLAQHQQLLADGNNRHRLAPLLILDPPLLARLYYPHQLTQRVQAAREADVGVKLHENFLRLADGQPSVQTLIQCRIKCGQIAGGHRCSNQGYRLLLGRQRGLAAGGSV